MDRIFPIEIQNKIWKYIYDDVMYELLGIIKKGTIYMEETDVAIPCVFIYIKKTVFCNLETHHPLCYYYDDNKVKIIRF